MRTWVNIAGGWLLFAGVALGFYLVMNPGPADWEPEPRFDGPAIARITGADDGWLYAIYTDGTVMSVYEGVERGRLTLNAYEIHKAAGGVIISHDDGGTFLRDGSRTTIAVGGYINDIEPSPGGAYLHVISRERRAAEVWYFDGQRVTQVIAHRNQASD